MHNLLVQLFEKRKIKGLEELQPQEKETFENWQRVLSTENVTVQVIQDFCENQVSIIERRWHDLGTDQSKKAELIPYHTVYKALLQAFQAPQTERENLEKYLNQLIQQ